MSFLVQKRLCATCIYRKDSPLDVHGLEAQVADPHMPGFFRSYRVCHHTKDTSGICCAGFWRRHRRQFTLGQLAQRLGLVRYVTIDDLAKEARTNPMPPRRPAP